MTCSQVVLVNHGDAHVFSTSFGNLSNNFTRNVVPTLKSFQGLDKTAWYVTSSYVLIVSNLMETINKGHVIARTCWNLQKVTIKKWYLLGIQIVERKLFSIL